MLQLGDEGFAIRQIQNFLGLEDTGTFDEITEAAVKNLQRRLGIYPSGIIDGELMEEMSKRYGNDFIVSVQERNETTKYIDEDIEATTDISEKFDDIAIEEYLLPEGEYVSNQGKFSNKQYIFLHHTAGWNNPYKTVDNWGSDTRGRIGTHFVIGGIDIRDNNNEYDGKILQCIPDEYFAYHLGGKVAHGIDSFMHKHSIGIEICNFGWLSKKNGIYYTYTGREVHPEHVEDLENRFRGHRYWHKYTDKQIISLKYLIEFLSDKFNINIYNGLYSKLSNLDNDPFNAFEYDEEATNGEIKGLLSHTSVRTDKTDVSPQSNLIKMIKNLDNRGSFDEYFI